MSKLPKFHIPTSAIEIDKHGVHADGIAGTSYGSHQIRVDPHGYPFDDQHNFRGGDKHCISNNDPRGTAHGGYNR